MDLFAVGFKIGCFLNCTTSWWTKLPYRFQQGVIAQSPSLYLPLLTGLCSRITYSTPYRCQLESFEVQNLTLFWRSASI